MSNPDVEDLDRLRGGLVVSCQAGEGNPLQGPGMMAAMAAAAVAGGAVGIRAEGGGDVAAIRARVDVPIEASARSSTARGTSSSRRPPPMPGR